MTSERMKHLELVSAIVQRMGQNSFALKGWCITLIAAIFALGVKETGARTIAVGAFPAVLFWFLDSYYLWQERKFRSLYDDIRDDKGTVPVFSMDTSHLKHLSYWNSFWSLSTASLYIGLLVVVGGVFAVASCFPPTASSPGGWHV